MESSRTAFLLARFFCLIIWFNAVFEVTYIPDRLVSIESYRLAATKQYYMLLLVLLLGRILFLGFVGLLLWWNAPRVARWLEGKQKEEHLSDVPPLSLP